MRNYATLATMKWQVCVAVWVGLTLIGCKVMTQANPRSTPLQLQIEVASVGTDMPPNSSMLPNVHQWAELTGVNVFLVNGQCVSIPSFTPVWLDFASEDQPVYLAAIMYVEPKSIRSVQLQWSSGGLCANPNSRVLNPCQVRSNNTTKSGDVPVRAVTDYVTETALLQTPLNSSVAKVVLSCKSEGVDDSKEGIQLSASLVPGSRSPRGGLSTLWVNAEVTQGLVTIPTLGAWKIANQELGANQVTEPGSRLILGSIDEKGTDITLLSTLHKPDDGPERASQRAEQVGLCGVVAKINVSSNTFAVHPVDLTYRRPVFLVNVQTNRETIYHNNNPFMNPKHFRMITIGRKVWLRGWMDPSTSILVVDYISGN